MKIAVFSDSHGNPTDMLRAVRSYAPDLVIHLGDGCGDTDAVREEFPDMPIRAVRGNCDFAALYPEKQVFSAAGATLLITHGHLYRVRFELEPLLNAAHFSGADVVLFGHTHSALYTQLGGVTVINPGSIGEGASRSWARLEIDNGGVQCVITPV